MKKRAAHMVIGLTLSGLLVWLLFRDVNWAAAAAPLDDIHWGWFLLVQLPLWWVMFIRVVRWRLIVASADPDIGFRPVFSATQVGFLANMVLPARLGELVRPLALSRLAPNVRFSQGVALAAVDRLTDLVGLLVSLLIAVSFYTPPERVVIPAETFGSEIVIQAGHLQTGMQMAGVMFGVLLAGVVLALVSRDLLIRLTRGAFGLVSERLGEWMSGQVAGFTGGLTAIKEPWRMVAATFLSLVIWFSFVVDNAWYFNAFGLDYVWPMAFVMQAMLMISISVPGAPGFVGQFHVPIVVSLVMIGVAPDPAKGMAILFHLINILPVFVLGIFALWLEDLALLDLAGDEGDAEPTADAEPVPAR